MQSNNPVIEWMMLWKPVIAVAAIALGVWFGVRKKQ